MTKSLILAAALLVGLPAVACAGPASDLVRKFYAPIGFEPDPSMRGYFVDPAKAVLENFDRSTQNSGEAGCIDFVLAIDAQDFDQSEVDRTLKLEESLAGDTALVTARFQLFADSPDSAKSIEWTLTKVGADWKVADIASEASEWRLSSFDCN